MEIVELTQSKEEPLHHEPKSKDMEKLNIYCHTGKETDLWTKVPKSFGTANVSTTAFVKGQLRTISQGDVRKNKINQYLRN